MMKDKRRELTALGAPCGYLSVDAKGKETREFPCVDCDRHCEVCGWNQREKKRRLETGVWEDKELVTLNDDGEVVSSVTVKQLKFKAIGGTDESV